MPNRRMKALTVGVNTYDLVDETSGYITGMTILSYGSSSWQDFLAAYNAQKVVYCRASSQSNPASGSQTRLAFMAYVNDATNPTSVEFQYYRSVSSKSIDQQGDQVFVYTLTSAGSWSVTTRETMAEIRAGGDLTESYSNGVLTISGTIPTVPTNVSAFTNDAGYLTSYTETDPTVPSWAKASSKPSYNFSEIGSKPTTLSGYGITDALTIGTTATTAAAGNHTHTTSLATDTGTSTVTLASAGKYKLTAGGTSVIFTMPTIPTVSYPVTSVNTKTGDVTLSASDVGAAASSHAHGNITSGGDITATAPTIANGDQIVINDSSASKITNGPTFDGSTTNKYLSPKGTWESLPQGTAYQAGTGLSLSETTFNHSNSVTAQTTQAVYPIKIDAQGHISAYGSAVTIPTKVSDLTNDAGYTTNTGTVTGVTAGTGLNTTSNDTTTDGGTISSSGTIYLTKSGATAGSYGDSAAQTPGYGSTFKVPYITVDKYGRVTSISEHTVKIPASDNTNTTYTLTNALSSHKFTETLTAGGSGSGTSTATMEFVAGTGITLTDDTTNKKITITCSVTNTDEKLKTVALTNSTTYYPILATGANSAANRQVDSDTGGFKYISVAGTTSLNGTAILSLGNEIVSGTVNNELGVLRLYDSTAYYIEIRPESGSLTANRAIYLPSYAGTMYFTCTDTTNSVGGATTAPVYVDNTGRIQAVTSIPYSLLTSTPTIPSITLNGSSSTSPSFYAPTSAGTSGYVLTSSGSGAPSWSSAVLTDQNVKSTAVTAATTNYIVGSTTSTTTTGGLSKHASAVLYTTADSGTSGYTQLRLGNTTATSSAGGKEGQIRLYGTTATYYVDLKAGAPSANRTITFPNATGTVALTSDIPSVSGFITSATLTGTYNSTTKDLTLSVTTS